MELQLAKTKRLITICLLCMCSLTFVACTKMENVFDGIVATSWSDDSSEIVFLEKRHVDRKTLTDVETKKIQYRVGLTDRSGQSKRYITDYFDGISNIGSRIDIEEVFYKSNLGYFVVRVGGYFRQVLGLTEVDDREVLYIFNRDGSVLKKIFSHPRTPLYLSLSNRPKTRIIPSPSGSIIAVVEAIENDLLEVAIRDYSQNFEVVQKTTISGNTVDGLFWGDGQNLLVNAPVVESPNRNNWTLLRSNEVISISDELFSSLCLSDVRVARDINVIGEQIDWEPKGETPTIVIAQDYSESELKSVNPDIETRAPNDPENCVHIDEI